MKSISITGSDDNNNHFKVSYSDKHEGHDTDNYQIRFYQTEGVGHVHVKGNVFDIDLFSETTIAGVIRSDKLQDVPAVYHPLLGEMLAALHRVFAASKLLK